MLSKVTYGQLRYEVRKCCQQIDPNLKPFAFCTKTTGDGSPHVEISSQGLHYIVMERGKEVTHKITKSKDELLYWLICGVAFSLACDF